MQDMGSFSNCINIFPTQERYNRPDQKLTMKGKCIQANGNNPIRGLCIDWFATSLYFKNVSTLLKDVYRVQRNKCD